MSFKLDDLILKYSLESNKKYYNGIMNGYQSSLFYSKLNSQMIPFIINCKIEGDSIAILTRYLEDNKKTLDIYAFSFDKFGVELQFVVKGKVFESIEKASLLVTTKLRKLKVNGADYCSMCGELLGDDKKIIELDNLRTYVHSGCHEKYKEKIIKAKESEDMKPNNYGKGVLGAVLGALLGCVIWGIMYFMGLFSAMGGIVVAMMSSLVYDALKGKKNNGKIIIVGIVSLVLIIVTSYVLILIELGMQTSPEQLQMSLFKAFTTFWSNSPEFKTYALGHFVKSILFGACGVGVVVFDVIKGNNKVKFK